MKAFLRSWYSNKGLDKRKQPMQASRWVTPGTHLAMFLCTRHCSMQIGSERTNLEPGGLFCLTHKRPQLGNHMMITWFGRCSKQDWSILRDDSWAALFKFPELQRSSRAGRRYLQSSEDISAGLKILSYSMGSQSHYQAVQVTKASFSCLMLFYPSGEERLHPQVRLRVWDEQHQDGNM